MFRCSSSLLFRLSFRSFARYKKLSIAPEENKVKILSADRDDQMKISFRFGNVPNSQNILTIRSKKHEKIGNVLNRIKLMVDLQKKKEELRRVTISRLSGSSDFAEIVEDYDEDIKVDLLHNDGPVSADIENVSAWTEGTLLKIGDTVYEVNRNTPSVVELSLPEYILPGMFIRPHFLLECAIFEDCKFTWYRSKGGVIEGDENEWVKVFEGFNYLTKAEDIGHKLKVVCEPGYGEECGPAAIALSKNSVEMGPKVFPFEERHQYTKDLVGPDCIRCVSYNILANIYVEKKRFPYSSRKARDGYYRKQLTLKELMGYNSDIICLQEVQERVYDHDLLPVLSASGFQGYYLRKGGRVYEGVALFFRESKFRVVHQLGIYLNEAVQNEKAIFNDLLTKVAGNYKDMSKLLAQDTALQIMHLQHVDYPEYRVLVANTHLYSNKDTPEVRLIQAVMCTQYLEHLMKSEQDKVIMAPIFCGDFNSLPDSDAVEFVTTGNFKCCTSWKNSSSSTKDTTLKHSLRLGSACGIPEYTNYTQDFMGCLDYVFYDKNNLDVIDVVPMPSHTQVTEDIALPSELFPSDHIALVCTLRWKHWKNKRS